MYEYNWTEILEKVKKKMLNNYVYDDTISKNWFVEEFYKLILKETKFGTLEELGLSVIREKKKAYERTEEDEDYNKYDYPILDMLSNAFDYNQNELSINFTNFRVYHLKELLKEFSKENILHPKWKNLLNMVLRSKLSIRGTLHLQYKFSRLSESISLNHYDRSSFLALKAAINSDFIVEKNNSITLSLSGGMMANIQIRKMGVFLKKQKTDEVEKYLLNGCDYLQVLFNQKAQLNNYYEDVNLIYNTSTEEEQKRFNDEIESSHMNGGYTHHEMYNQSGYTNSTIEIPTSYDYYILVDDYVMEIRFESAPILFGYMNPMIHFKDTASINKVDDEEEEERRKIQEEEDFLRERKSWDDDYI